MDYQKQLGNGLRWQKQKPQAVHPHPPEHMQKLLKFHQGSSREATPASPPEEAGKRNGSNGGRTIYGGIGRQEEEETKDMKVEQGPDSPMPGKAKIFQNLLSIPGGKT